MENNLVDIVKRIYLFHRDTSATVNFTIACITRNVSAESAGRLTDADRVIMDVQKNCRGVRYHGLISSFDPLFANVDCGANANKTDSAL